MKKIGLLFVAIIIALTILCVLQSRKLAARQSQVASLSSALDQKSKQLEVAQGVAKRASRHAHDLLLQTAELNAQLQARQQAEAQAAASAQINNLGNAAAPGDSTSGESGKAALNKNGFGNFLSKMMQDPAAKKFIRDQQRMMMDQLYAPLVKQMALTPDESEKFKDLLADNMIKGAEKASSLLSTLSETNGSESLKNLAVEQKNSEEEVKALLGESRFAQYTNYQATAAERMQLNAFKQTGAAENALTDEQTEQLLAIMKEEREKAAAAGLGSAGLEQDQVKLHAMFSEEQLDKLVQSQEGVSQRVIERANQVLSPTQLEAFGKFQTNQLQMMRVGMSMARKLFGADKTESASTPASQ